MSGPAILWELQPALRADEVKLSEGFPTRAVLLEELRAIRRKTCPFRTVPDLRDNFRELSDVPPQWVRPAVVVEVEYRQRLNGGLRHAALKGIRPDKRPRGPVETRSNPPSRARLVRSCHVSQTLPRSSAGPATRSG